MSLLDRRSLIAGALAATAAPALIGAAAPGDRVVRFSIFRDGQPFGHYAVAYAHRGDVMAVVSDTAMSARIAGMTVFNYRHHCEEIWRGGRFMEMRSHTIRDNQKDLEDVVKAVRAADGIRITTKAGLSLLPPDAHPLTHWNSATLRAPLFNPANGFPLKVTAAPMGKSAAIFADGSKHPANQWAIRGETELDEWYDDAGDWLGLRGPLKDGKIMEYRRV